MALKSAQYLNQYDFSGGIDISKPSYLIDDQNCWANPDSYNGTINCFWDNGIRRRKGTVKLNTTTVTGKIIAGTRFYRSSTPQITTIVAVDDSTNIKIYYLNGTYQWIEITGGSAIPSSGTTIEFTKWKDNLYIATGTTLIQVISYSGSWSKANISGQTAYPACITMHKDRLWAAGGNMPVGYLECTGYEVDNSWAAGTGEGFNVGFRDGDPIVKLMSLRDDLTIYKSDSIWVMKGDNIQNWFEGRSQGTIGCAAKDSVVDVGYGHIFLSDDNIYFYDGTNLAPISNNIKTWLDQIPLALRSKATACYHDTFYSIAIAKTSSASYNDFELMCDIKYFSSGKYSWWANDGRNISCYIPYDGPGDDKTLIYCDMANSNIWKMVSGDRDDNTIIKMEFQTKHFIFGEPNKSKNFGRLKLDVSTGVGSFQINLLKNTNNEYILPINVNTFGLTGTTYGSAVLGTTYYTGLSNARATIDVALPSELDAYAIAYKINYSEDKSSPYFYGFSIEFKEKEF